MYDRLVIYDIYITWVSQKQTLTDPSDVNLTDNQLRIHDKFYQSYPPPPRHQETSTVKNRAELRYIIVFD